MHSILSLLVGGIMVALVYGLSFVPSATLNNSDEAENQITQDDQNQS
jgi:hypothetical protein